jgi:5,10-methylenetetrahydromethanopterin reductase
MGRLGISLQSNKRLADYAELGALVDHYDFENLVVYEDLFFQPCWPALMQLALHTRRVKLGPSVVNPYTCHPVPIAANLALLHETSHGRAFLGVGRGAFFAPVGLEQPRPLQALRELVEMVQRLLVGDRTPYSGKIFRADSEAYLRFKIPGRRLPVLVGTWGRKTCGLAGQIADEVKIGGCVNPQSAPVFRDYIAAGARKIGRDPREVCLVYGAVTVVDRDRAAAEALARRQVAMYLLVVGRLDPTYQCSLEEEAAVRRALLAGDEDAAARAISTETLRRFSCYGTPADVVERMGELFDAGVDRFEFGTPHGLDEAEAIRLLGEEVLPEFKQ